MYFGFILDLEVGAQQLDEADIERGFELLSYRLIWY
jgi:hypothetical protein